MDDEIFVNSGSFKQVGPFQQQNCMYTDTIGIFVETEWGSSTQTGLQLCPAVFIPSASQIPRAVKHIYRLVFKKDFL